MGAEGGRAEERTPSAGVLAQADRAVFQIERAIVVVFLCVIAGSMFVDVVHGRLVARDSKLAAVIQRVTGLELPESWTPWLGGLLALGLVWFASWSSQRAGQNGESSSSPSRPGTPLLRTWAGVAIIAAGAGGVGLILTHLSSRVFYVLVFAVGTGAYLLHLWRSDRIRSTRPQVAIVLLAGAAGAYLAYSWIPPGYTWSQELSLMMLLWIGFLGASVCAHENRHLRIEAFDALIPDAARRGVRAAAALVAAGFSLFLTYLGWDYVQGPAASTESAQMQIPDRLSIMAVPIGFGITTLRFAARATRQPSPRTSHASSRAQWIGTGLAVAAMVLLPWLGNGGLLGAALVALAVIGAPLFVVIGAATVLCFLLWTDVESLAAFSPLIERTRTLADSPNLLAIPMFIMAGAVMSRGAISAHLVEFAKALIGWVPGGLAISTVVACMLFAAISGSSPATVIAMGSMMGPALIAGRFRERFAHGLLTSAGSLGILIPPSIPMILYPIIDPRAGVEVEQLFASGLGPGLLMGALLIGYSIYRGWREGAPRSDFAAQLLVVRVRDGFWSLAFPVVILGGIYTGAFNALEASAVSVVYAVVVEVWIHRAIRLRELPSIFHETGVFLGSLLVIMIAALVFTEFLEGQGIPEKAVHWIRSLDLERWEFLVALNLLLLAVGAVMDILSAMFVFVPLLSPVAIAMGIEPMHFGIIFIVNLELGYLTPPVGLNLFVASTLFERPVGHVFQSVVPFLALMAVGLAVITYVPEVSVGMGRRILGIEAATTATPTREAADSPESTSRHPDETDRSSPSSLDSLVSEIDRLRSGSPTMAQMNREAQLIDQFEKQLEELRAEAERLAAEGTSLADMRQEAELRDQIEEYERQLQRWSPDTNP